MPHDSLTVILLILGFGFVIFFHELGHFLAAKWVGIKVEQFAVGFGQALLSYRRGIGLRFGSTNPEYEKRIDKYLEQHGHKADETESDTLAVAEAERAEHLGETEYRLNWIPLGGYVKMLGQDDLRPNSAADDPRAYNRKSIPARMLVVSAGVIMNIILAAIGFTIVFRMGFHVPPAVVGGLYSDSPAQRAGMQVGDVIYSLDGKRQWDFTKVGLNAALLEAGVPVPLDILRDGKLIHLTITPEHFKGDDKDFVELGIESSHDLRGLKDATLIEDGKLSELVLPETLAVMPGETITQIDGKPAAPEDYQTLDSILQSAFGRPIVLSVLGTDGKTRTETIHGHFAEPFSAGSFNLAGMVPRTRVETVLTNSPARGKLLPGDVIESASYPNHDKIPGPPTRDQLTEFLRDAGADHQTVSMKVLRNVDGVEREVTVPDLQTGMKLEGTDKRGLGIVLGLDEQHPIIADVLKDTPAAAAAIPRAAKITAIDGQKVASWYDVHRILLGAVANVPVDVQYVDANGEPGAAKLTIDTDSISSIHAIRYASDLQLADPTNAIRKATSVPQALAWSITETRDFILQFYLTLRRMIDGSLSPSNMMGPVGIFIAGKTLAFKGMDWLIWFLSMISANLAVVNFLPIPIVDGGLFTFLILERIQGKPLSPRTQAIAQYAGLAFLVCVFVFVTYHDITSRL